MDKDTYSKGFGVREYLVYGEEGNLPVFGIFGTQNWKDLDKSLLIFCVNQKQLTPQRMDN